MNYLRSLVPLKSWSVKVESFSVLFMVAGGAEMKTCPLHVPRKEINYDLSRFTPRDRAMNQNTAINGIILILTSSIYKLLYRDLHLLFSSPVRMRCCQQLPGPETSTNAAKAIRKKSKIRNKSKEGFKRIQKRREFAVAPAS